MGKYFKRGSIFGKKPLAEPLLGENKNIIDTASPELRGMLETALREKRFILAEVPPLTTLEELERYIIPFLNENATITTLDLSDIKDTVVLQKASSTFGGHDVSESKNMFDFHQDPLSLSLKQKAIKQIAQALKKNTAIIAVKLDGQSDEIFAEILTALKSRSTQISALNLSNLDIKLSMSKFTEQMGNNLKEIKSLNFSNTELTHLHMLAPILKNNALTDLNLSHIQDQEWDNYNSNYFFSNPLPTALLQDRCVLKNLDLSNNHQLFLGTTENVGLDPRLGQVMQAGGNPLLAALSINSSIEQLNLSGTHINTLSRLKGIADLITHNKTLTHLDLSNNKIGDKGWTTILAALRTNTTLTDIKYDDTGLSGEKKIKIEKEIEDCLGKNRGAIFTATQTALGKHESTKVAGNLQAGAIEEILSQYIGTSSKMGSLSSTSVAHANRDTANVHPSEVASSAMAVMELEVVNIINEIIKTWEKQGNEGKTHIEELMKEIKELHEEYDNIFMNKTTQERMHKKLEETVQIVKNDADMSALVQQLKELFIGAEPAVLFHFQKSAQEPAAKNPTEAILKQITSIKTELKKNNAESEENVSKASEKIEQIYTKHANYFANQEAVQPIRDALSELKTPGAETHLQSMVNRIVDRKELLFGRKPVPKI